MPAKKKSSNGLYIYAILPTETPTPIEGPGLLGETVFPLAHGPLVAVVSVIPNERIRPERRHLGAHQEVLKRILPHATPLPVSFGLIADDDRAVRTILADHCEAFLEQLGHVEGKVEMGLRVIWDVPNIFEYFVNLHSELKLARDRFLTQRDGSSRDDKIEVGRLFDRFLTEDREASVQRVEQVMERHDVEVKANPCREERDVMNLACLVDREARQVFEEAVFEAARGFDDSYTFDFNGPWAPYNFVELALDGD